MTNEESIKKNSEARKHLKHISGKLLRVIIPMIIGGLAIFSAVILINISPLVTDLLHTSMSQQVNANAAQINRTLNSSFYYMNGIADTVEKVQFGSNDEIKDYLSGTINRYDTIPAGLYIGLEDGSYIDAGWTPPADYNVLKAGWFKAGMEKTDKFFYYYDQPYFDENTGKLCSTVYRHITLKDGREGVICSDILLGGCQDYLNKVKVFTSGHSMMITSKGMILSSNDKKNWGKYLSKSGNDIYKAINSVKGTKDGKVVRVNVNGKKYMVCMETVTGTDWRVVNYAKISDVLARVNMLLFEVMLIAVILISILAFILTRISHHLIQKPVKVLTENIEHIAKGDFTVKINDEGNDEISFMNSKMNDFISRMRDLVKGLQDVGANLSDSVSHSKESAETLAKEAEEQSFSMENIRDNMDNMADAVQEVANSATTLAQTVGDLTAEEQQIEGTMEELVKQADAGQKNMNSVSQGMNDVITSMSDMNEAVEAVNDAAEQINQIVDMISSIASQTNLLSLNASIEAARAGEAGKGFAVVATEIGQLANDSDNSTKQIADIISKMTERVKDLAEKSESNSKLINDSVGSVTSAAETFSTITSKINDTTNTLSAMAEKMKDVSDVATNVASISEEQSASTQEITASVEQVTASAKKVADSSKSVKKASDDVAEAVDQISENVQQFKVEAVEKSQKLSNEL